MIFVLNILVFSVTRIEAAVDVPPDTLTETSIDSSTESNSLNFNFIDEPSTTIDRIYNLLLVDSISGFIIVGYFVLKSVFGRMRTFRNWKGDKK